MLKDVTLDDLRMMYAECLVIYKNKPIYIESVISNKRIKALDLSTQRSAGMDIDNFEDLKAPGRCFGYVNVDGYVIYVARMPMRRYRVGITRETATFTVPDAYKDSLYVDRAIPTIRLQSAELADTVFNRYPTIAEAWRRVKAQEAFIVAFDRQFAIDRRGNVYYKNKVVGKANDPKTSNDIKFDNEFTYLITLLDNNYEKCIPTA